MGDPAGQRSGDGPELGTVLALLHRADTAFDRVEATYRIWRHAERAAAAWQAQIEDERRRGASITSFGLLGDEDTPAETTEVLRIWRDGDRVREERHGGPRDGDYAVRDGDLWWSWNGLSGATSNQDDPDVGFSVGEEISLMLDPTPLLGSLRFAPIGGGHVAGRESITIDALPRLSDPRRHPRVFELHQLGGGADRYTLEVDARLGVLLAVTASRDGEPFHEITTEQIHFDRNIPDERFTFQPPPGEEIQPTLGRHRLVRLPLPEAQRRAAFTILIPDRIPHDWHYTCAFIEASARPPSPAGVSLHYHSDDGHRGLSLTEHAAGEQPDQYDLMMRHDEWQTLTRDGTDVRFRTMGNQAQACVERLQTFVFLMSESLPGDELAALAAGLKPAPTTAGL